MDAFDFRDENAQKKRVELIWNILTIVVLLSIVCVFGYTALTILSPSEPVQINVIPDSPTPVIPTATPTPRVGLPPTWTPGPSPTSKPSATSIPTQTLFPSATAPVQETPSGNMSYETQGDPQAIQDFGGLGCSWTGVGGAITDLQGAPVMGLFVQLGGVLKGETFETQTTMSGIAQQYGPSGYEFKIGDAPVSSENTLWVQLIDQAGLPLSNKIYFDTLNDCTRNLIYISFKQVR